MASARQVARWIVLVLGMAMTIVAPSIAQTPIVTPSLSDEVAEIRREIHLLIEIRVMEQRNVLELVDMSKELAYLQDPRVAVIIEKHLKKVQASEIEIQRLEKLMEKVPCKADGKCS
jgi:hypothetical protein